MKIKYFFIFLVSLLLLFSLSQIFIIPPYEDDIYPYYKSGYFSELDRGEEIIRDAFLNIKILSQPVKGWIFLKEIEEKHEIKVEVFNRHAYKIYAPGKKSAHQDASIEKILKRIEPEKVSEVSMGKYVTTIPIKVEKSCIICHQKYRNNNVIGAMRFTRGYDGYIYYSSERIIVFILISITLLIVLFFLFQWDPEQSIKELFDKS